MSNLRNSIRFKTKYSVLDEVIPQIRHNLRHPTPEGRGHVLERRRTKILNVRLAQQAEKGLTEFPFELITMADNAVIKKHYMNDDEAMRRNWSIKSLGMAWRRSGY